MWLTFKTFIYVFIAAMVFLCLPWLVGRLSGQPLPLEIFFLDVGQGDATLISYKGEYQCLIDGGPNGNRLLNAIGRIVPPHDKRIELVILTHPDKDHLAGLIDLMRSYQIGLLLDNGQANDTAIYQEFIEEVEKNNIRRESMTRGSTVNIGEGVRLETLSPERPVRIGATTNDASIVLKLSYGSNTFLLMGDAEETIEKRLVADQAEINVDWLKVAHHGSGKATMDFFLQQATPDHAIISVGKENRYRHPSPDVIDRLAGAGTAIIRTDECGTIRVGCGHMAETCQLMLAK